MSSSMAESKRFSEDQYLKQVNRFNIGEGRRRADQKPDDFGLDGHQIEQADSPSPAYNDIEKERRHERRACNVLLNYIDQLEKELHRQEIKIKSLSRELHKSKKELTNAMEDRDHWIKQHTDAIYQISKLEHDRSTSGFQVREQINSIKNELLEALGKST